MVSYLNRRKAEEMDSINQRISKLVKRVGKQNKFAELCGIKTSTLNMIVGKNQVTPATATIEKILSKMPDVNPLWLYSGDGPMLREATRDTIPLFKEEKPSYPEKHSEQQYVKEQTQPLYVDLEKLEREAYLRREELERKEQEIKEEKLRIERQISAIKEIKKGNGYNPI